MALSQLEGILTYIQTQLQAIAGIGNVLTVQPIALQAKDITEQMGQSGEVHYWTISPVSTTETWLTNRECQVQHDLAIRGYREVGDWTATEPVFRQLTTMVADILRETHSIGGITNAELFGPVQTTQRGGHVLLAGTFLCHYCECHVFGQELLFMG